MTKKRVFRQNDHIILPKSTLKRFVNPETQKIKYLDLNNPENIEIKEKSPRSFHTQLNYYIPEYDDKIKIYETMIGKYYKMITDAYNQNTDINIYPQQLKTDIIDIVNIQFQRTVIADDEYLYKLLEHFKEQYRQESLFFLRQGIYPKEFQERKQKFEQASKNINTFRYYAQRIIGQNNSKIFEAYKNFVPHILIIPNQIGSTFILSPQHFVPIGETVRIIISPRIALALYPVSLTKNNELIKYLTQEEVDFLVPRTIESAISMTNSFRQIIGEENYLNSIKTKLERYKSILPNLVDGIILIKDNSITINDGQIFLELAVSMKLFKPNCHKIVIEMNAISSQFLQTKEFINCIQMFERWEFVLIFINNNTSYLPNINIKVAKTKEEAIAMLK